MAESVQKKLDRVRKPRVHIKYEVETEGAMVVKELPFVVGVTGDFSGDPTGKLPEERPVGLERLRLLPFGHEQQHRSQPSAFDRAGSSKR